MSISTPIIELAKIQAGLGALHAFDDATPDQADVVEAFLSCGIVAEP